MAQHQESVRENDNGRGGDSMIGAAISGAASMVARVWNAVMADGMLEAGWRQGIHELGTAFGQMGPDSISVHETGTIFNPTPGEVAANRADTSERAMWPSEIARQNRHLPVQDHGHGHENGYEAGHSM